MPKSALRGISSFAAGLLRRIREGAYQRAYTRDIVSYLRSGQFGDKSVLTVLMRSIFDKIARENGFRLVAQRAGWDFKAYFCGSAGDSLNEGIPKPLVKDVYIFCDTLFNRLASADKCANTTLNAYQTLAPFGLRIHRSFCTTGDLRAEPANNSFDALMGALPKCKPDTISYCISRYEDNARPADNV